MDYKDIAKEFVNAYYECYNPQHNEDYTEFQGENQRDQLFPLYREDTLFTYQHEEFQGAENIMSSLTSEKFSLQVKKVVNISAQPSLGDSLLIMVQGDTWFRPDEGTTPDNEETRIIPFTELFLVSVDFENYQFSIYNQIFSTEGV